MASKVVEFTEATIKGVSISAKLAEDASYRQTVRITIETDEANPEAMKQLAQLQKQGLICVAIAQKQADLTL